MGEGTADLENLRDHFETLGKVGNYLLVGNAAGFSGVLSVLSQPGVRPTQFRDLDIFVVLFGAGLLLASLNALMCMTIKINVGQAIIAERRPGATWSGKFWGKIWQCLAQLGFWGAAISFCGAVLIVVSRFWFSADPIVRYVDPILRALGW